MPRSAPRCLITVKLRQNGGNGGEFAAPESMLWSKKTANRFLLCCLLDAAHDRLHRIGELLSAGVSDVKGDVSVCRVLSAAHFSANRWILEPQCSSRRRFIRMIRGSWMHRSGILARQDVTRQIPIAPAAIWRHTAVIEAVLGRLHRLAQRLPHGGVMLNTAADDLAMNFIGILCRPGSIRESILRG